MFGSCICCVVFCSLKEKSQKKFLFVIQELERHPGEKKGRTQTNYTENACHVHNHGAANHSLQLGAHTVKDTGQVGVDDGVP